MSTEKIGVGAQLWYCENNRWHDVVICGENRKSWIYGEWRARKILKEDLTENMGAYGRRQFFTAETKEEMEWIRINRCQIVWMVERCCDVEKLKKIQEILID